MEPDEMKRRTKAFAVRIIKFVRTVPRSIESGVVVRQLVRCATSVGANYRAACLARSKPDFISKMSIAAEEVDESLYWMELLTETGICSQDSLAELMREARELTSIVLASIKTARASAKSVSVGR